MSSDEEALLRAVQSAPDDDAPRGAYADWLEENGQEDRAELIRLYLEWERQTDSALPRAKVLQRKIRKLFDSHPEWLEVLAAYRHGAPDSFFGYRRGFVEVVSATPRQVIHGGSALHPADQVVRTLELMPRRAEETAQLHNVLRSKHIERFTGVILRAIINREDAVRRFFRSPLTQRIRRVEVRGTRVGTRGIAGMLEVDTYPPFQRLELWSNRLDDSAVRLLATSPRTRGLTHLNLGGNVEITNEGVAALADSPNLTELRDLYLWNTRIDEEGVARIAASPHLAKLDRLYLLNTRIGPAAVSALADSTTIAGFRLLYLARLQPPSAEEPTIGDAGSLRLADSPTMKNLEVLFLDHQNIGNDGAAALADSPNLQQLRFLKLTGNRISADVKDRLKRRFGRDGVKF